MNPYSSSGGQDAPDDFFCSVEAEDEEPAAVDAEPWFTTDAYVFAGLQTVQKNIEQKQATVGFHKKRTPASWATGNWLSWRTTG